MSVEQNDTKKEAIYVRALLITYQHLPIFQIVYLQPDRFSQF